MLAKGGTVTAAASAANVTRQTVHRWLNDEPQFADSIADARAAMLDQAIGTLTAATEA